MTMDPDVIVIRLGIGERGVVEAAALSFRSPG
jgi:hypothetical protein